MKISYNIQQFKNAIKRNSSRISEIYYRGKCSCRAKTFYMQTKKAYITYVPTSYLDAYFVCQEAINSGYKLIEIGDLIDDAKKI